MLLSEVTNTLHVFCHAELKEWGHGSAFFHSVSTSNLLLLDRARFHAHTETYSSAETWTSPGGQVGRRPYTAGLCPKFCIFGMEAISTAWLKEWCGLLKGTWRLVNLWKPSHSSSTATSSSHHPYLLLQVMRSSKNVCKLITRTPSCVDIWIWLATWRVWEHEKKHSMLLGRNTKKNIIEWKLWIFTDINIRTWKGKPPTFWPQPAEQGVCDVCLQQGLQGNTTTI